MKGRSSIEAARMPYSCANRRAVLNVGNLEVARDPVRL